MKLRNKITGEIADLSEGFIKDTYNGEMIQIKPVAISNKEGYVYGSLAELNKEWEDYEEPKEPKDTNYWCIDSLGKIEFHSTVLDEIDGTPNNAMTRRIIGNYFETREEAEKAVEKLKAWKRLKDKGISFEVKVIDRKWYVEPKAGSQQRTFDEAHDLFKDVMVIFGGEE